MYYFVMLYVGKWLQHLCICFYNLWSELFYCIRPTKNTFILLSLFWWWHSVSVEEQYIPSTWNLLPCSLVAGLISYCPVFNCLYTISKYAHLCWTDL